MSERIAYSDIRRMLDRMREHALDLTGQAEAAGFQIAGLIRILSNQYERFRAEEVGEDVLSGPRMWLLVRLLHEEMIGNKEGITPTQLSHNQNVSRNTISALLRGLEEQGLIERQLDPEDRRLFRIRLSNAGREKVKTFGPRRITLANQMVSGLTADEQAQLIDLLARLLVSIQTCEACLQPADTGDSHHPQPKPALD